jgi:hypothetical protein
MQILLVVISSLVRGREDESKLFERCGKLYQLAIQHDLQDLHLLRKMQAQLFHMIWD